MNSNKLDFAYRVCVTMPGYSSEYASLEVEVSTGISRDASAQYVREASDYYLERLKKIRELTGGVRYFDKGFSGETVTLRWQADRDGWKRAVKNGDEGRWYAMRIDNGRVNQYTAKVLAALLKYGEKNRIWVDDFTPQSVITALKTILKARRIQYMNDVGGSSFMYRDTESDDKEIEELIGKCPWVSLQKELDREAEEEAAASVEAVASE